MTEPPQAPNLGSRVIKRYRDAYSIAAGIDAQGQNMKSFAILAAVLVGMATLLLSAAAGNIAGALAFGVLVIGVVGAAAAWALLYSYGVRVAAEGQHLLASLDVAVNTSPLITDAERAEAMGL